MRYVGVLAIVLMVIALTVVVQAQDKGDGNEERTHGSGDGDGMGNPCDDHAPGVGGCEEPTATPTPTPTPEPSATAEPTATQTATPNPDAPPPKVTGVNVIMRQTSAFVGWSEFSGVDRYKIQYREAGGKWKTRYAAGTRGASGLEGLRDEEIAPRPSPDDVQGKADDAYISGLTCETEYKFRVQAYGDEDTFEDDWGPWSDIVDGTTTDCVTPPPPTYTPPPTPTPRPCPGCLPPTSTPTPTPTPTPTSTPTPTPTRPLERAPDPTGFEVAASTQSDTIFVATWDAHDGIKEYQLQHMEDGGVWISEPRILGNALRPPDELINRELTATVHLECGIYYGFRLRAWGDTFAYTEQSSGWVYEDASTANCVEPIPPPATPEATPDQPAGTTVTAVTPSANERAHLRDSGIDEYCRGENDHWAKIYYNVHATVDPTTQVETHTFEPTRLEWRAREPSAAAAGVSPSSPNAPVLYKDHRYKSDTYYLRSGQAPNDGVTVSRGWYSDNTSDCGYAPMKSIPNTIDLGGGVPMVLQTITYAVTFETAFLPPGDGGPVAEAGDIALAKLARLFDPQYTGTITFFLSE